MKTKAIWATFAVPLLIAAACATTTGSKLALDDDREFAACGAFPNCVSSDEVGRRSIEPIETGEDLEIAWQALLHHVQADPSYEIRVEEADYLRAIARSRILRFIDDVEFHRRPEAGQIAMRSASRVGLSDLGKNRRRLEAARQAVESAISPSSDG